MNNGCNVREVRVLAYSIPEEWWTRQYSSCFIRTCLSVLLFECQYYVPLARLSYLVEVQKKTKRS